MSSPAPVNRRTLRAILAGSIATPLLAPELAFAEEAWPARTVRYVNGFPAGGATDTLSRILCQKMSELSGQSFVVENRAGGGRRAGRRRGGEIAAGRIHGRSRRHRPERACDRKLCQASL